MNSSIQFGENFTYLKTLDQQLNIIYPLILVPFGMTGNLITFYIYTRKCFKKTSIGFYYSCLAIVDTLALCLGAPKFSLNSIGIINIVTYSKFTCKFFTSSIYILAQFSAWIIVLANIDRLILVISNRIVYKNVRSVRFEVFLVAILFIFIFILNIPNIIYLEITTENLFDENNSYEPVLACELGNKKFYNNNVGDIIDLFIFSLIPFSIMIVTSSLITATICKKRAKLNKYFSTTTNTKNYIYKSGIQIINNNNTPKMNSFDVGNNIRKKKKELHFTFTILGTNILFLTLNLPICLVLLIRNYNREQEIYYELRAKLDVAFTFANIFSYLNFSSSIIVHTVLNHIYRAKLKKILLFLKN